jgi:hypothetical protein
MIYESRYWKDDLLKQAQILRRRINQKRWPESSFAHVEQSVMLGFYSIRKLIEAKKLSDDIANQSLRIIAHSSKGKTVTRLSRTEPWQFYDLEHSQIVTRGLTFLCNQIVHSYIFMVSFDESKCFDGILVASDHERHKMLYFIQAQQIIELFEQAGNDYPDEIRFKFDSRAQDYTVQSRTKSRVQETSPND